MIDTKIFIVQFTLLHCNFGSIWSGSHLFQFHLNDIRVGESSSSSLYLFLFVFLLLHQNANNNGLSAKLCRAVENLVHPNFNTNTITKQQLNLITEIRCLYDGISQWLQFHCHSIYLESFSVATADSSVKELKLWTTCLFIPLKFSSTQLSGDVDGFCCRWWY